MSKDDIEKKPQDQEENIEDEAKKSTEFFLNFMKKSREDENKKKALKERNERQKKSAIRDIKPEFKVSQLAQRMSLLVVKIFNQLNRWMDLMMSSDKRIRWLSLLMTLIIYVVVSGGTGVTTARSIDIIQDVPVIVQKNESDEVIGYDETVNIQLIGNFTDIQLAKLTSNYQVYLDTTSYSEGVAEVRYTTSGFSSRLEVSVIPESAEVTISPIRSQTFDLSSWIVGKETLDTSISLGEPVLAFNEVEVRAGQATLDQIDRVVARIDVTNLNQSVDGASANIVALDASGRELDVQIEPSTVRYSLDVVENAKDVPIRAEIVGSVQDGYAIADYALSAATVKVFANPDVLESIDEIVLPIDVSGLNRSQTLNNLEFDLPEGVVRSSLENVDVELTIEPTSSKQIDNIPIQLSNIPSGLDASVVNDAKVSIMVTGAQSLVDQLTAEDITATIDLTEARRGSLTYEVTLTLPSEFLTYTWVSGNSVVVEITG
ncbi:YbbR-like protein [Clostridiales bacterium CHKCI006]|nr:YbbR-like protein [Clostridiales bacterium CHKCI006]